MSKKIIFFDADGTIIRRHSISPLTLEAFKRLRENGHVLVLSTGRAYPAIDGPLGDMGFENIICSAGGTVVINNEIVYTNPMNKESQRELLEYFDRHNVIYNMETNEYIYTKKGQKEKYMNLFSIPEKDILTEEDYNKALNRREYISKRTKEIDDPLQLDINKIHYYEADILYDNGKCPIAYKQIEKDLGHKYNCVSLSLGKMFSGGEICEKEVSKQSGMKVALKHFDVKLEDIYAIGDDYNDREMLEFAPNSIAMGQAPKEIKELASYITRDVENDGFYYAMKHFNLI